MLEIRSITYAKLFGMAAALGLGSRRPTQTALIIVMAGLFGIAFARPSHAIPIQFSGNSNFYDAIAAPGDWFDARTAAENLTFNGVSGHLVTITSAAEQDFLNTTFPNRFVYAIGALQDPSQGEPSGGFAWITGEDFIFTNFGPGEPNNAGGAENTLVTANFDRPPMVLGMTLRV